MNSESKRLAECSTKRGAAWRRWGPYVSERQWGTVREDYSLDGNAWEYFPFDDARLRAYRWGEDGIGGVCDEDQLVCIAPAFWNGSDPFIKERLFGLNGKQGNHAEDVKECYFYLDNTPTHSYMKMLYRYPQMRFPYEQLIEENARRSKDEPEFELPDTGIFGDNRCFDVFIEYAKASPNDILMKVTAWNRGPEEAALHILPHVWFRNTWSWERDPHKPLLTAVKRNTIEVQHHGLGRRYWVYCEEGADLLFCENESNVRRLYGIETDQRCFKDGINEYVVNGVEGAVNPERSGTKAAVHHRLRVHPGKSATVRLRLSDKRVQSPFRDFDAVMSRRMQEADEFYHDLQLTIREKDARLIHRQALAGMLWAKQFYCYDVARWLAGDPLQPPPPPARLQGRNNEWPHLNNADIISMPDKWEYPWYAAWDTAFHCIPLALVDPEFAKHQLVLLTREWYMHPNGQLPAYEWSFSDVNPPVHAWATWRVYKMDQKMQGGKGDIEFLERVFHKMLLNFTWWVNRKDTEGRNVFQGGFLGLDNIGVFDRSAELPTGGRLEQADATSWMAMYCLNMMRIALELALTKPVYQDLASKFFEHFLYIAGAMANIGGKGISLWDEEDEFFYDVLHTPDNQRIPLKVRSMVGLIPFFAVETLEPELLDKVPEFKQRLEWFLDHRPDLATLVSRWQEPGMGARRLLSLLRGHRMKCLLRRMLDPDEFLSDFGVRALSKYHEKHPYVFHANGTTFTVRYRPGESDSWLFGGNSNWRGPVWFPVNFLIIESLQKFHHYYGNDFKVEYPTGSGTYVTINDIADGLAERLTRIFLRDASGRRAVWGLDPLTHHDPHLKDCISFYEYFHGDTGKGLGASHQTGWTGLVAKLLVPREREEFERTE